VPLRPPATTLPTRVIFHGPLTSGDVAVEPMRTRIWRSSLLALTPVDENSTAPHGVLTVPGFSPGFTVSVAAQPGPATLTP